MDNAAITDVQSVATPLSQRLGRKVRLAYLVTHPIQYQVPLLRLITAQPDIELTAIFQSDISVRAYYDPGFDRKIEWDVPLLDGYRSVFLPSFGDSKAVTLTKPYSHGIRPVLKAGQFDALWMHGYARPFNWAAIAAAWSLSIPVLMRDEANPISARRSPTKTAAKRAFFRMLSGFCKGFLAIGSLNRQYYLENGIAPGRISMVPYCVDNDYFAAGAAAAAPRREAFRAELGLEPDRPIILFASKFQARKKPDDLLAAFERLMARWSGPRRPYLVYVGDGDLRQTLEAQAQPIKEHVKFMGFRNQSELPAFFDLCDVFVLPSDSEPWGLIVNEVMSAGRAVIISDRVGCAPDLVKNGVNGFVFPIGDIDALSNALGRVVESPDTAAAMGRAGAEIIAGWSYKEDVDGLREALAKVLAG